MNRDDIIRMARQAANCLPGYTDNEEDPTGEVLGFYTHFAALVAAAEREACADVCEGHYDTAQAARAIRARGQA